MADGAITFSTDLDNKQLEKDLMKARKEIEKLEKSLTDQKAKRSPLVTQAEELEQKIRSARAEVTKYREAWVSGAVGADKDQSDAIVKTQRLEAEYAKVVAQIDKIDSKLLPSSKKIEKLKAEAGGLEQELAKAGSGANYMGKAVGLADKRMDQFVTRVKGLAHRVMVFSLITMGLRSMRDWMGKVLRTNDEATAAIARLKGALLTLAQPLVNVVIPAFTLITNVLAQMAWELAEVTSTIFGTTLDSSKEAAEGLYDETEALDETGAAAKKAKKSLAGFDEINKLSGDTATSTTKKDIKPDFFDGSGKNWLEETLDDTAKYITTALLLGGVALVAIGACMGSLALVAAGLGLLGAGISTGNETGVLQSWADALGLNSVPEFIALAVTLGGIALVAIGAATANILFVLAGLGIIGGSISYSGQSGMMGSWTEEQVSKAASYITAALLLGGIVLVAIGAATANILMVLAGLGLLAAGIYVGVESGTLESWAKKLGLENVFDYVVAAIQLVGFALIAIGAAMGNIYMVIAGGVILSAGIAAQVIGQQTLQSWWEVLQLTTVQQWVSVALLLVGVALIAIGAMMANILMVLAGVAMIGIGVIVGVQNENLKDWVSVLGLEKVAGWVTAVLMLAGMAFVVFGIMTANVLMVVAGIGMMVAGFVIGTESGTFGSWVEALQLEEVAGWVSTALLLAGIALIAIGAITLNPLMLIAGLGLLGAGAVMKAGTMTSKRPKGAQAVQGRNVAMPTLVSHDIPALAAGAVIPPNREFLAVLGDQKSGTNIEAPVSEIEAAVARGIEAAVGSNAVNQIELIISAKPGMAREIKFEVDKESRRRGVKLVQGV